MRNLLFRPSFFRSDIDVGLLLLRLFTGAFMLSHGIPKLMNFSERMLTFPDPLGVGHTPSLVLAVFAEVFCSITIMFGLLTRFSALTLFINMVVIAFVIHGDDPWKQKEFALLYAVPYLVLTLTGAGRFSLDAVISRKTAAL